MPSAVLPLSCALLGLLTGPLLRHLVQRLPAATSPPAALGRHRHDHPHEPPNATAGHRPPLERTPVLEIAAASAGALAALAAGWSPQLPALAYLAWIAVALAVVDLEHRRRLPDALVLPSYLIGAVLLAAAATLQGDTGVLLRAGIGLAVLWLGYLVLALAQPAAMGFGDVKLAGLLGMHLGYLGWPQLAVGAAAPFILSAPLALLLLATRRAIRTSTLPFGPLMLLGAAAGVALGDDIAGHYLGLLAPR